MFAGKKFLLIWEMERVLVFHLKPNSKLPGRSEPLGYVSNPLDEGDSTIATWFKSRKLCLKAVVSEDQI